MKKAKQDRFLITTLISIVLLLIFGFLGIIKLRQVFNRQSMETENQITYETSAVLPEKFPTDFPIYPNSHLTTSWTNTGEENLGISVIWETLDSLEEVEKYYTQELQKSGWVVNVEDNTTKSQVITFEKQATSGFIGLTKGEVVTISVTLGLKHE